MNWILKSDLTTANGKQNLRPLGNRPSVVLGCFPTIFLVAAPERLSGQILRTRLPMVGKRRIRFDPRGLQGRLSYTQYHCGTTYGWITRSVFTDMFSTHSSKSKGPDNTASLERWNKKNNARGRGQLKRTAEHTCRGMLGKRLHCLSCFCALTRNPQLFSPPPSE